MKKLIQNIIVIMNRSLINSAHCSHFGYRLLRRPPGAGLPRQCGAAGLACPGGS